MSAQHQILGLDKGRSAPAGQGWSSRPAPTGQGWSSPPIAGNGGRPPLYKKRRDSAATAKASTPLKSQQGGGRDEGDGDVGSLARRHVAGGDGAAAAADHASQTLSTPVRPSRVQHLHHHDQSPSPPPPSIILCCSKEEAEDYQVDLCPRSWFSMRGSICHAMWRVVVVCCCLPICYPCYLTRKFRHKRKQVLDTSGGFPHSAQTAMKVTKAHKVTF